MIEQNTCDALASLGWNSTFANQTLPEGSENWIPGRVINEERGLYRVHTGDHELWAELPGRLRYEGVEKGDLPAVGDWVLLETPEHSERGVIRHRLERQSVFSRKRVGEVQQQVVAANVQTLLIAMSLNQDFNLRRLERYLVMAWESQATPVVLLTKADLCEDIEDKVTEVESVAFGVPIHVLCALEGRGMEEVNTYFQRGHTLAVVGSSGVGKSTLLNYWMHQDVQDTGGIRGGDDKGKHTTTSRKMFFLPSGAMLIDTPGMRELQLWNSSEGLQNTFGDVEVFTEACRFRDCSHHNEPGCAVRQALEDGELDAGRWVSYQKLQRELAHLERKQNKEAQRNAKRRWKNISLLARANSKMKEKQGW